MSLIDFFRGTATVGNGQWNTTGGDWSSFTVDGLISAAGEKVNHLTAENYSAVWAATRAIAENLASLPAVLFEQLSDNERSKAVNNPLFSLLRDQPNDEMDAFTFYEMQTARLLNRGNAYAEIERDAQGRPIALWPIDPSRVQPWRLPSTLAANGQYHRGQFIYRILGGSSGLEQSNALGDIPAADMLNVVGPLSRDGITAPGVVDRAAQAIGVSLATEKYVGSFFANGAVPTGVLQHPGKITDPQVRDNIRREWNSIHQSASRAHKIAILWEGMEYKDISASPEAAQLLGVRKFNTIELSRWYGVAPAILQDFSDSKFQTVEAQLKHFALLALRIWAIRWEKAIGCQLLGKDSGLSLEFNMKSLLRGDPKTQAETNEIRLKNGVINQDQWRAEDGENPLPDGLGQHHWIQANNLAPIEQVLQRRAEEPPPVNTESTELRQFATRVLNESYRRMVRAEIRRINTHAQHPKRFLEKVDNFYDAFASELRDALRTGCEGVFGEDAGESTAWLIAQNHCQHSRQELLDVCVCQPEQLNEHVRAVTHTWHERRIDVYAYTSLLHAE